MKATDFNLKNDFHLDPSTGIAVFGTDRLVVLNADAIGLLRRKVVESLGLEKARELFLQFGFQNGYSDFLQMQAAHGKEFDTEMDLLASGPVIHSWEGIVNATPKEIKFDRKTGEFYFTGIWKNSYEADQHLASYETSKEPVCWSVMGYASGWCSAFFGAPLFAYEPVCVGKGDEHCEWLIQPLNKWGKDVEYLLNSLMPLYKQIFKI